MVPRDVEAGRAFLPFMRSWVEDMDALGARTARRHIDNLWLLGGELIRELHADPATRKDPVGRLMESLSFGEGPLLHSEIDEAAQGALDTTVRSFWRHLKRAGLAKDPTAALRKGR